MAEKLKERVDELSETLSFTTKNISELQKTIAASKKSADQAASKVSALKKRSPGDSGVKWGWAPYWRSGLEDSEGGDTMSISEGGGKIESIRKSMVVERWGNFQI